MVSVQLFSFWWDSAGPTYYHQVAGLLGIGVPKSQFLFGTVSFLRLSFTTIKLLLNPSIQDFPYAPIFTQAGSLAAVKASTLFSAAEKTAIFKTNAQNLFGNKLPH